MAKKPINITVQKPGTGGAVAVIILVIVIAFIAWYYLRKRGGVASLLNPNKKPTSAVASAPAPEATTIIEAMQQQPGNIVNPQSKIPDRYFYGDTWVSAKSGQKLQRRPADAPKGDGIYWDLHNTNDYTDYQGMYNDWDWNWKGSTFGDTFFTSLKFGDMWKKYVDKVERLGIKTYGTDSTGHLITAAPASAAAANTGVTLSNVNSAAVNNILSGNYTAMVAPATENKAAINL